MLSKGLRARWKVRPGGVGPGAAGELGLRCEMRQGVCDEYASSEEFVLEMTPCALRFRDKPL